MPGLIENKVFITLEETIARRAKRRLIQQHLLPEIETAGRLAEQGQFDAARDIINGFDFSQILPDLEGFLRTKFVQAALFGASQLTPPETSVISRDPSQIDLLEITIQQFNAIVENGITQVQAIANKMIRQMQEGQLADVAVNDGVIKSWGGHVHGSVEFFKNELAGKFIAAVHGNANALVDIGANLTTSRVIQYGFLIEAFDSGLQVYMVSEVLDERTCPVCEVMHGQTFDVVTALERVGRILRMTDPKDIREAAPFPKQDKASVEELRTLDAAELSNRGFDTPPYHPMCRGIVVEVDRNISEGVETVTPLGPPTAPGTVRRPTTQPSTIQPPQVPTNITAPPPATDPSFTNASAWYNRYADKTVTSEKVLTALDDPVIKTRAQALNNRIKNLAGTETDIVNKVDGVWTAERRRLHRDIIRKILTPERVRAMRPLGTEQPQYTIFGGRAGSGKSFLSKRVDEKGAGVLDKRRHLVLDSDEIKALIPEYKGWNAFQVHEESSYLMDRITRIGQRIRMNIVHDGTMAKEASTLSKLASFESRGYAVEGYYVFVPPQESARRSMLRWKTRDGDYSGRYVPLQIALNMTKNEQVWDVVKNRFRRWRFYDNQGSAPRLISSGGDFAKAAREMLRKLEDSFVPVLTDFDIEEAEMINLIGYDKFVNDYDIHFDVTTADIDADIEALREDFGDEADLLDGVSQF